MDPSMIYGTRDTPSPVFRLTLRVGGTASDFVEGERRVHPVSTPWWEGLLWKEGNGPVVVGRDPVGGTPTGRVKGSRD